MYSGECWLTRCSSQAGTETLVTNAPPPIRRLPSLLEPPRTPVVSTSDIMPGSVTTMNTSVSPQVSQKILARSRDEMRRNILCVNGFPSKNVLSEICRTSLQAAAVEFLGTLVRRFKNILLKKIRSFGCVERTD